MALQRLFNSKGEFTKLYALYTGSPEFDVLSLTLPNNMAVSIDSNLFLSVTYLIHGIIDVTNASNILQNRYEQVRVKNIQKNDAYYHKKGFQNRGCERQTFFLVRGSERQMFFVITSNPL